MFSPDHVIQNQRNSSGDNRSGSGAADRDNAVPVRLFLQRGKRYRATLKNALDYQTNAVAYLPLGQLGHAPSPLNCEKMSYMAKMQPKRSCPNFACFYRPIIGLCIIHKKKNNTIVLYCSKYRGEEALIASHSLVHLLI